MALTIRFDNEEYDLAVAEMDKQDDRSCVIVAASILEDVLRDALKSRFRHSDKDIEGQFMKGYGPLASFRAKIDLAFLLGIFDLRCHRNMVRIKDIRNKMAHKIRPLTFLSEEIIANTNHLPTPKELCLSWKQTVHFFEKTTNLSNEDRERAINLAYKIAAPFAESEDAPRSRYLMYVQHRISALIFAKNSDLDPKVGFLWKEHY